MSLKSSNVAARVEPEIKEQAEAIMSRLGLSASAGINMFYRQIILWNGLPFRPAIPVKAPPSLDAMTKEEFDAKMARGLAQAKAGVGMPADEFCSKGEKPMKTIHTENAPAAIGPYSQAIVVNGFAYTSGQIALDPKTGTIAGDTIEPQTEQAIQNLKAVLEAAGSSLNNVVKTTCFLQRMSDFAAFNAIYEKHFPGKPARSCVEVAALPKAALVEIEAVAVCEQP